QIRQSPAQPAGREGDRRASEERRAASSKQPWPRGSPAHRLKGSLPASALCPLERSWPVLPGYLATVKCSSLHRELADLAHKVNRTGSDDQAVSRGHCASPRKRSDQIRGSLSGNIERVSGGQKVLERRSAGIVDRGKQDMVVRAIAAGVKEREK